MKKFYYACSLLFVYDSYETISLLVYWNTGYPRSANDGSLKIINIFYMIYDDDDILNIKI